MSSSSPSLRMALAHGSPRRSLRDSTPHERPEPMPRAAALSRAAARSRYPSLRSLWWCREGTAGSACRSASGTAPRPPYDPRADHGLEGCLDDKPGGSPEAHPRGRPTSLLPGRHRLGEKRGPGLQGDRRARAPFHDHQGRSPGPDPGHGHQRRRRVTRGPYDLWREGETTRRVRDLVGAFAQFPHLPKMLNAGAILETLVSGCVDGLFVLRLMRPDRSLRTFWRESPDETALKDPGLEVVLPEAAELASLAPSLLVPTALPNLWPGPEVTVETLRAYFGAGAWSRCRRRATRNRGPSRRPSRASSMRPSVQRFGKAGSG